MKNESKRAEVLRKYKEYIRGNLELLNSFSELDGKVLACYCYPKRCHGNILMELRQLQIEGKL